MRPVRDRWVALGGRWEVVQSGQVVGADVIDPLGKAFSVEPDAHGGEGTDVAGERVGGPPPPSPQAEWTIPAGMPTVEVMVVYQDEVSARTPWSRLPD